MLKILVGRTRRVVKFIGEVVAWRESWLFRSLGFCGFVKMGLEWDWLDCNMKLLEGVTLINSGCLDGS